MGKVLWQDPRKGDWGGRKYVWLIRKIKKKSPRRLDENLGWEVWPGKFLLRAASLRWGLLLLSFRKTGCSFSAIVLKL